MIARTAARAALAVGVALGALLPGVALADAGHGATPLGSFRFEPPPAGSYELPPIIRVGEHQLVGSNGQPAPVLGIGAGECALVSFVYLSCGEACPLSTATLHHLDRELASDAKLAPHVQLVTVSFDPARDTPENMAKLERALAPKGRWRFLTAREPGDLAPVLADFGQDAVWVPDGEEGAPDKLRHVLKVFLVDEHGAVRNIYSTGLLDPRLVVNDLRTVLGVEGGHGAHSEAHAH